MRRGIRNGVLVIILVFLFSSQLVLAQHQLGDDGVNIKGEEFDITIYDPDKNVPFVDLTCEPQKDSDRIHVTLIFKNTGGKTLSGTEYTFDGKSSTGNRELIPNGIQKLNASIKYSGESVITKKVRVTGYFGTNSYYTADYTIRFYVTDNDVTARVLQGTDIEVGQYTPREEVQNIKRVLPYFYDILDAVNDLREKILSSQTEQGSGQTPSSPSSAKRIIVIEEMSREKGEERVKEKGEYVRIEYRTTIQKVIVEFDEGEEPGYRVVHNVKVLESNATGSMLWMVLSVSKEIAPTTNSMILSKEMTVLQEDPIVGLEIPSEEGHEGELDATTITSKDENEFLSGIDITHSISPREEISFMGQSLPLTNYILIVTALLSTALIFLSLRRRASR